MNIVKYVRFLRIPFHITFFSLIHSFSTWPKEQKEQYIKWIEGQLVDKEFVIFETKRKCSRWKVNSKASDWVVRNSAGTVIGQFEKKKTAAPKKVEIGVKKTKKADSKAQRVDRDS